MLHLRTIYRAKNSGSASFTMWLILGLTSVGRYCECGEICYRPYAYDITEGRPRVLGVKRGTATCTTGAPSPSMQPAGQPLHAIPPRRALTEGLRAPTRSASTTRARSATSLDPQHGVVVMETWRQCIRSIVTLGEGGLGWVGLKLVSH